MERNVWIYICVTLCTVGAFLVDAVFVTCDRNYKKMGCFKEKHTKMELMVNDRDTSSPMYQGHTLDWNRFEDSVHSLACRCSAKAKEKGYTFFAIRFWGECYAGKDHSKLESVLKDPSKRSNECANHVYGKCDDSHLKECAGSAYNEYVYSLLAYSKENVHGGYTQWSTFSACTETCGNGIQTRERTCTEPEPKGKGNDCSSLGISTETRKCKVKDCPVPPPRWPIGSYGILSHDPCPPGWFEFTHCLDTQDWRNKDDFKEFYLGLGKLCGTSSVSFRYCFKGDKVPSRPGGFWTTSAKHGEAYVIHDTSKNKNSSCSIYGQDGGYVSLDTEDTFNRDTFGNDGLNKKKYDLYYPENYNFGDSSYVKLQFCKIGGANKELTNEMMEVGEFKQRFGFFVRLNDRCPTLKSPYGYLYGTRQRIYIDLEDFLNSNEISDSSPFIKIDKTDVGTTVCQYDPQKATERTFEWPAGTYGILSYLPCPHGWYEFTHCIDTDDHWNIDDISNFGLGLGDICGGTSISFRYCFKGDKIPSRRGFFSNIGSAYVINNVKNGCGSNGGYVRMIAEPHRNGNKYGNDRLNKKYYYNYHPFKFIFNSKERDENDVNLSFCRIGTNTKYMEVGEFGQKFGFFVKGNEGCPMLSSPYGILKGSKQYIGMDTERGTKQHGDTPFTITGKGNIEAYACQYDPHSGSKHTTML